jgi:hypothetical protein
MFIAPDLKTTALRQERDVTDMSLLTERESGWTRSYKHFAPPEQGARHHEFSIQ